MRQVEFAGFGGRYSGDWLAAKLLDEHRIPSSPGKDEFALCRKAVDPVLPVAVGDENVAVRGLKRGGRHVEWLARPAWLTWRPKCQQDLAGRCVPGDGMQAGVGDEPLVPLVDPDCVRRRELEVPVAVQRAVRIENDDPSFTWQDAADAASRRNVAHPDVRPAARGDRKSVV